MKDWETEEQIIQYFPWSNHWKSQPNPILITLLSSLAPVSSLCFVNYPYRVKIGQIIQFVSFPLELLSIVCIFHCFLNSVFPCVFLFSLIPHILVSVTDSKALIVSIALFMESGYILFLASMSSHYVKCMLLLLQILYSMY